MTRFQNFWVLVSIGVITVILGASYLWWTSEQELVPDERLLTALGKVAEVYAYTQAVDTETIVSDRKLRVSGIYHIDGPRALFESHATTTLTIPEETPPEHSFALENISIGDDVYTRITTESPILSASIPHAPYWRHFNKYAIPQEFNNIAISGAILDNLLLFKGAGAFLSLQEKKGEFEHNGTIYSRYLFTLSPDAPLEAGGTLGTLLNRINGGTVEIWVDETPKISRMVVQNEAYTSTTTFSGFNAPLEIVVPTSTQ